MSREYRCEEVEVDVGGLVVYATGEVTVVVDGVDDEGDPVHGLHIEIAELLPVVIGSGKQLHDYVHDRSLTSIPIAWKDVILEAIRDRMAADAEDAHERRMDGR